MTFQTMMFCWCTNLHLCTLWVNEYISNTDYFVFILIASTLEENWKWYFIDIFKMARIGIGILLKKSEWTELVLVFYWCPKVDNAQPW